MEPSGSQIVPRRSQDGAKMAPRGRQDGPKIDFADEKPIHLAPIWSPDDDGVDDDVRPEPPEKP